MKWFYKDTTGLKADIERHREEERKIQSKIDELKGKDDEMSKRSLMAYRRFLVQIQTAKDEITQKIGKGKNGRLRG